MNWLRNILNQRARMTALEEEIGRRDELINGYTKEIEARADVLKAYQQDMQQQSAELVRLRRALERIKTERNDWRERAIGYRERMGGQKRRARG